MKNLKSIIYLTTLAGIFAMATILTSFTTEGTVSPYNNSDGEGQWVNLKVLPQNITKDSLLGLMKGYNQALGVKCTYCHVKKGVNLDAASDDKKEKEYARQMITMTRKINAENFNWANSPEPEKIDHVKCIMCHRGDAKPSESLSKAAKKMKKKQDKKQKKKQSN